MGFRELPQFQQSTPCVNFKTICLIPYGNTYVFDDPRGFLTVSCEYAVLHATSDDQESASYCVMYNPDFHQVPESQENAFQSSLVDLTPSLLCADPGQSPVEEPNATWAILRGNCTFSEKAKIVQEYNGFTALIITDENLFIPGANQTSDYNSINKTVAMMEQSSFNSMMKLGQNLKVQMYAPPPPVWDYSLIIIWLLAVGTLATGGYVSGLTKHQRHVLRKRHASGETVANDDPNDLDDLDVSPLVILALVLVMCGFLVALYFFYDYLVYVVIAMFALAGSTALYGCLKPLLLKMSCLGSCRIPANNIPLLKQRPEVRSIVFGLICLAIGVTWAVFRNSAWAWILQDILGIFFCVHLMKTIRLSSLKIITILLVLLFLYDIFFVFITPLFTKGNGIMVDVATGGKSKTGEQLPMVLKVHRFEHTVSSICGRPYALLGFGDIVVPGLLVSYCYGFDLKVGSKKIYYIASVIAYGLGLIITFVALALMQSGQPALLYLVPCTVLTTLVIACCRRELKHMWRGHLGDKNEPASDRPVGGSSSEECPGDERSNNSVTNRKTRTSGSDSSDTQDVEEEKQALLVNES